MNTNIPLLCSMLWIVPQPLCSLEFNRDNDSTHHPVTLLATPYWSDRLLLERKRSSQVSTQVHFKDRETGKANLKIKR